ncbi:GNAT family N-acetyltransferase [Streptomyces sp. NPDC017941]|uniref:GNAT family N-acetyltransferase n=1 Tax=Streptomyces sp. NPDC017941 TaxID=3365018 RepID=UPI0037AD8627
MRIRAALSDELPRLQDIERAAGLCFRDVGMAEIAEDEPPALDVLARHLRAGLAWVAVAPSADGLSATADPSAAGPSAAGVPVAYLIADRVDGNLHVEQVSVHPGYARRGIGRSLLDHLADRAAADAVPALTLTTFRDVPWNAPYYARCGFAVLDEEAVGPELRAVRADESALGLDRWPRVCMGRPVRRRTTPGAPPPATPAAARHGEGPVGQG